MPGMQEWLLIALVVLVLFGGKKLPEFARGIGTSIRELRNAMKDDPRPHESSSTVTPVTPDANARSTDATPKG